MLLTNYSYITKILGRQFGGLTSPVKYFRPEVHRNFFNPDDSTNLDSISKDSFPTGANSPYAYVLGDKGALLSATTQLNGTGDFDASLTQGINIESTINGTSSISTSNLSLIVQLASSLAGSGDITSASLVGTIALAGALSGSGSVASSLSLISNMNAALAGSGSIIGTLRGTLDLEATIYVNQSEATVQQLVEGVWNALVADFNNAGTMGEAMGAAGTAGDPWTTTLPGAYGAGSAGNIIGNLLANIPDSVWDELKTTHTTASTYGKIVQDLETLAKQIKALTSALQ
jgi:hypothetical protein